MINDVTIVSIKSRNKVVYYCAEALSKRGRVTLTAIRSKENVESVFIYQSRRKLTCAASVIRVHAFCVQYEKASQKERTVQFIYRIQLH